LELKDSQYQAGLKLLTGVDAALQQVSSGLKRKEEASRLRRRIEEVEGLLKRVRKELRI
jgi:hypothetical protein